MTGNMVGGAIMVDCTGLDFITHVDGSKITGLYNKTKTAMKTGKPMIACNAKWNTRDISPIDVFAIDFTTEIIVTASTLQVIVEPDDSVTINNMAPAEG